MKVLFVTGTLAAPALTETLGGMRADFEYEQAVLNISVAALMPMPWIARHLQISAAFDLIMLPGLCEGDPAIVEAATGIKTVRGPKDLKDIPAYFGRARERSGYGGYHTQILAEIVDAARLSVEEILARADYYRASGADIIDL